MITFSVRGPPVSTNHGYRLALIGKRPALIKTDEAKNYSTAIAAESTISLGYAPRSWDRASPVVVEIDLYFPDERGDTDGPVKFILDSLQGVPLTESRKGKGSRKRIGGVIDNDRQVRDYRVRRFVDREHPRTVVRIRPLAPATEAA